MHVSSLALAASLTSQYWSNWKAARPRLTSFQLGRTRGAVWRGVKRSWRDGPRATSVTAVHRGRPQWSSEPLRTAVSAEMAKSGHAFHPAICRSDEPELGVVVAACGGHREARCENEHSGSSTRVVVAQKTDKTITSR